MAVKKRSASEKTNPLQDASLVEGRLARAGEPTYQQLVRALRARLLAGAWTEGQTLPSVRVLGAREKVSLATVQRAYDILVDEGLLTAAPGKAYFPVMLDADQRRAAALAALHADVAPAVQDAVTAEVSEAAMKKLLHELVERALGQKPSGAAAQALLQVPGMGTVRGQRKRKSTR